MFTRLNVSSCSNHIIKITEGDSIMTGLDIDFFGDENQKKMIEEVDDKSYSNSSVGQFFGIKVEGLTEDYDVNPAVTKSDEYASACLQNLYH